MTRLSLIDLHDRGLKSFDSLSPLERDAFVLIDLDLYYEMEGSFEDYVLSGGHERELDWLAQTLQRIGDSDSARLISQLRQKDDVQQHDMALLCDQYYELRHERWQLLRHYFAQHSAEIVGDG